MQNPFILSIEPTEGKTFTHGFHLGTILSIAMEIAVERFHSRNLHGMHTKSVALMLNGRVYDVYDGGWASDAPCFHDEDEARLRQERSDLALAKLIGGLAVEPCNPHR